MVTTNFSDKCFYQHRFTRGTRADGQIEARFYTMGDSSTDVFFAILPDKYANRPIRDFKNGFPKLISEPLSV